MSTSQGPITDQKEMHERRTRLPTGQPPTGEGARERLLAGLPITERRLRLNGVSTAVLEGGDGPPIVLLHGPGEYAAKWLRVIPDLVRTHRVIAPDLPGHGTSEGIDRPLDVERILAWLDDLIECTCPTPPVLVGQILGGAITARFASARSERLSRLMLVDAFGLAAFQPAPEFGLALNEFVAEPTEDTHDRLWRRCAFDLDRMRTRMGEQWEWIKAYNLDRARTPELQATQHGLMEQFGISAIPPEDLARIVVPTTLIWGRQDLATSLSVAQATSSRYGWPLHVIENAADDPPMEQPEVFLEVLRAALGNSGGKAPMITREPDTRAAWDKIAAGYDEFVTPLHINLGEDALRPAMRFLDVAAGSGAVSIPAARLGARVLSVDISPTMVERLKARARKEGLSNLDARVMDGQALELESDTFDMSGSQFGVMLFPDLPRGVSELARVTKPGGRVVIVAFGSPMKIEFFGFFIRAIQAVVPGFTGPPMDPLPLPFQLQDPERVR